MSVREVWLNHADLDVIAKSGARGDEAKVVDLKDNERAIVWVNGRVEAAEAAAMRSQANTAKILESSPTLMRLRELEVPRESVAEGQPHGCPRREGPHRSCR